MSRETESWFRIYGEEVAGPVAATRDRIEAALWSRTPNDVPKPRAAWTLAAALVAAAIVALVFWRIDRPDAGHAVTIATSATAHVTELPRDGRLEVMPESRVTVRSDVEWGAEVDLLQGEVGLAVQSGPGVSWRVRVAAYTVEAVGTRFTVRRERDRPEVRVDEGVVRVNGPGLPEEGLRISADRPAPRRVFDGEPTPIGTTRDTPSIEAIAPAEPVGAPQDEPEAEAPVGPLTPSASETRGKAPDPRRSVGGERSETEAKQASTPTWQERFREAMRSGDTHRAVDALPPGFPDVPGAFTAADLVDAGDALRATGAKKQAEAAYVRACERAPRSDACGVATLRRAIARASAGDRLGAIALATAYLDAHPDGTLAAEALGRRMGWNEAAGRHDEARADARVYLRRWPDGPRAAAAQRLVDTP